MNRENQTEIISPEPSPATQEVCPAGRVKTFKMQKNGSILPRWSSEIRTTRGIDLIDTFTYNVTKVTDIKHTAQVEMSVNLHIPTLLPVAWVEHREERIEDRLVLKADGKGLQWLDKAEEGRAK